MSSVPTEILPPRGSANTGVLLQDMIEAALNLPSEEADKFRAIARDLEETLQPADIIDRFWIGEAAIAIYDHVRLQEMERRWLESDRDEAVAHLLAGRVAGVEALIRDARLGNEQAKDKIDALLAANGLTEADIYGQAYRNSMEEIERLGRLRQRASVKLSQIVRDIEGRRLRIASRLSAYIEAKVLTSKVGS